MGPVGGGGLQDQPCPGDQGAAASGRGPPTGTYATYWMRKCLPGKGSQVEEQQFKKGEARATLPMPLVINWVSMSVSGSIFSGLWIQFLLFLSLACILSSERTNSR